MRSVDIFGKTETLDARVLGVMFTRLEARGQHPIFRTMLQDYLEAMPIDSTHTMPSPRCNYHNRCAAYYERVRLSQPNATTRRLPICYNSC